MAENESSPSVTVVDTVSEDDSAEAAGLELFDSVVGLWLPAVLALFGVVGNALSLWVLSSDPAATATLASLKALALSDLVLLIGALCQQIVPMLCDFASAGDAALCLRRGYLEVYAWPVVCIAQMSSVWLAVLISTERQIPYTAIEINRFSSVQTATNQSTNHVSSLTQFQTHLRPTTKRTRSTIQPWTYRSVESHRVPDRLRLTTEHSPSFRHGVEIYPVSDHLTLTTKLSQQSRQPTQTTDDGDRTVFTSSRRSGTWPSVPR